MKFKRCFLLCLAVCCLAVTCSGCVLTSKQYNATANEYFVFSLVGDGYAVSASTENKMPAEIVIPKVYQGKNVVAISNNGFYGLDITKVTIPDTVKTIGAVAFSGCNDLQVVEMLSGGVETISDYAFYGCASLRDAEMPKSLVSVGKSAFQGTSLSDLDLLDGVISVGENAFKNCTLLSSIYVGASVSYIGEGAFDNVNSGVKITVNPLNPIFELKDSKIALK